LARIRPLNRATVSMVFAEIRINWCEESEAPSGELKLEANLPATLRGSTSGLGLPVKEPPLVLGVRCGEHASMEAR
jgi:hypothetical protein